MNAVVKVMIAKLHSTTDVQSELVDEVLYGMPVEVLEEVGDSWVKIRTFYRYDGYTLKTNLETDSDLLPAWIADVNSVVIQSFADVLTAPKIQSSKLVTLTRGAYIHLEQEEVKEGWSKVQLVTGEIGYLRTDWIQPLVKDYTEKEELFREQVVQAAFSYLGTPYRWGGKTPLGIDCSGLCSMAYMLNGAYIYRDAKIMEGFPLREITRDKMKRGDLLFFPGHVAMYIGDDQYIHSSLGGNEVNINSLNQNKANYREDLASTITGIASLF